MKRYISCVVLILLLCCGCKVNAVQDKAEITPYSQFNEICYTKQKFEIQGIELSSPKQIVSCEDILFICDSGNSRIIKCDLQGNVISEFGKLGTMPGEFIEPICIDVSSSQICIYDRGSSQIQVLTLEGEPIWEHDLTGEFGFLSEIVDIEICDDGALYLSLIAHGKYLSSSGVYLLKDENISKISSYTVGCLAGCGNDIYFMSKYELEDDNNWITGYAELLKITEDGFKRVTAFSDGYSAVGLDYFNWELFAYNDCLQSIDKFSLNGEYIATVFSEPVVNDFIYKGFCSDKNGNLYLSDSRGNSIYKLVRK